MLCSEGASKEMQGVLQGTKVPLLVVSCLACILTLLLDPFSVADPALGSFPFLSF